MATAPFPHDLIQLQAAWNRTYAALAEPHPATGTAELRRRLVVLSARLWWLPFWSGPAPAARAQPRSQARALDAGMWR
ncbi:hypothetical protein [Streptomyces sp. NPDC006285]|uniref:hypothetical protein n=1 Tax=Streptomyces sp. NPDC006285 TaxID=3364742 RepID=UPI0036C1F754